MASEITERVLDELNSRRLERQAAVSGRNRELRENCPELKAVDMQIACAAKHDKALLAGLYEKRNALADDWLRARGLPPEWLTPLCDCNICKDTGFIQGKLCTCVLNESARRMFAEAGLTANSPTFDKFDLSLFSNEIRTKSGNTLREYMAFLKDMGISYADRFPDVQKPNMLFTGPTGSGKTFLLDSIASQIISRGFWVVRTTAFGVNDVMAKAMFSRADPESLFDCDLLALDDLGSEPILNKVTVSSLFNLLNERLVRGKPFIISTNLKRTEILSRYDERVFSRMTDARTTRIIEVEGVDLRRG